MAEAITIVGAIASTIQLVDFTIKVFDRLNHYLHLVDEVPKSLRGIRLHLPLFIEALRRTQFHIDHGHYNPMTSAVLKSFVDECNSQMILLEDILAKVAPAQDDSKMIRSRKAVCSLKHEKALKKIHSNLSGYIEKLLLFQSTVSSDYIMVMMKPMLSQNSVLSENLTASTTRSTGGLVADSKNIWATKPMSQKTSKSLANYYKNKKQYRFSQFMGLYWLGIPWAFQASLDLSWGNSGFSITPNLRMQQLVKHTSPAFEVSWKCQTDRQDIQSAREALFELFSTGTVSPQDVDPDGRTWLERILSVRMSANHDMLIAFFKMLCEWGAPMNTKTSESRGETTAQKALAELVRAIEFERAGITHVCCQRTAFSRGPMEEEEIDEILDEEKDFISELNDTMEQFVQSIDDGSIEENWLKTMVSFHAPETDNENNLWSWATWKGVSSSMSNNWSSPPPWHSSKMQDYNNRPIRASTASAVNEPRYWIDKTCDEFRREQGPITMQRIRISRLYSAWVEYFYRNQALHDYPTRIGKEWHERRKYWATRQAEILDNVSRVSEML
ncbi:hypothetical protein ALT_1020 [Aspergillus lentulus]|uniref:NACHT-NTPase and P-loop NTPases N-terminal domain-containing protein n=1 Tax=Aspergillus lentulus TaxID=293939 RepID=A0AAN4PBR0_ASPLE|nr:hypothetical protein ALT_1020 [Aspergillus lentulus]